VEKMRNYCRVTIIFDEFSNLLDCGRIKKFDMDIFRASREGNLEVVKELILQGANINVKSKFGETPLQLASREGHLKIVKELISQGAKIDEKDKSGNTPLQFASRHGHLEIVKELISQGANYTDLLEKLEKNGNKDRIEELEKIILEVADLRVKFIQ